MTSSSMYLTFILLFIQTCSIYGKDIVKGSLTFVIDDTASMSEEIEQVKSSVNFIFDTVTMSMDSQIENFILVTFNDPDYHLLTITKDRNEFKYALSTINVHGGGDCPEYAMSGIKLALQSSLPLSLVYVFTDASARDYTMLEEVRSMARKNNVQVSFLLTGECGYRSDTDYQVYHQLANATAGDVYNMMKTDIKDIMNFVTERIKGRDVLIASETFPPGYDKKMTYKLDSKMGGVYVSATGKNPKIDLTDHEDKPVATRDVVSKPEIAIKEVLNPKPGDYTAKVGSETETKAKIIAKTLINIQVGFASFEPTSPSDTATRPAPDGKTYLSVELQGEGVTLNSATILDMSGNMLATLPMRLVDEKIKFYVAEVCDPPKTFRVTVSGYDEGKNPVTREAPTPIERQDPKLVVTVDVAPTVTIEGASELKIDYGKPLQLKCKVHAYPKPDITWQDKVTGAILSATISTKEIPYDYVAILNIDKVVKNSNYECKATNRLGGNFNYVNVEVNTYFHVIETSKKMQNIEYDNEAQIVCNVDANPPATVTWFKDDKLLTSAMLSNVIISGDMKTVTIPHVNMETKGKYTCEAKNELEAKTFVSHLEVFGLKKPEIDKTDDVINVLEGEDAQFTCRVTVGVPKPTLQWYFQRQDETEFHEVAETGVTLTVKYVTDDNVGTYKCIASNLVGFEQYAVDLVLNYPPTIKDDDKSMLFKDGTMVTIPCDVDGIPAPTVTWKKGGIEIHDSTDFRITDKNSLRIREIKVHDKGFYTCEAKNKYGSDQKKVFVDVFVPVRISVPKVTSLATLVGKDLLLPCYADGYPKPEIKWTYNDFKGKTKSKTLRSTMSSGSLGLRRLQLTDAGFYTCTATNIGGPSRITFAVQVNAPPVIKNSHPDKTFHAIKGDMVLRIECKATGSPTPTIIWKKNGMNIATGSEWYDIEDGTLIIKNIDEKSDGDYLCFAENKIGHDSMIYKVVVQDHPIPGPHIAEKFIESGRTEHIPCDIPHKNIDLLRWYKDGKLMTTGELTLYHVKTSDDGVYSCRVSTMVKSFSSHVRVTVGYKPYFLEDVDTDIPFVRGDSVLLSCDAMGVPTPQVTWYLNDKELSGKDMLLDLEMQLDNKGTYKCEVKNGLGSIDRTFKLVSKDCILDTRKDFLNTKQPILTSPSLKWSTFNVIDHYMVINAGELFYLHCPKGFSTFPSKYVLAFCNGETKVLISGKVFDYSEIKCNEETELSVQKRGVRCLPGDTENVQVGYIVFDMFLKVYEVCLDKENNVPLYTKHEMSAAQYDVIHTTDWQPDSMLSLNFDSIYNCYNQVNDISATIGTTFLINDGCCFDKRQLVSPKDLRPGIPTAAAYTYLNVVPQWSTCNSKNWADVEERVRKLARSLRNDLTVSTGTARPLRIGSSPKNIKLHDDRGREQPVAEYLWKVVQDRATSRALAIIQVNVPDLSPTDAPSYVLCKDICHEIVWMQNPNWRNTADGYTYCCKLQEFEAKFNYRRHFSDGKTEILKDVISSPFKYY